MKKIARFVILAALLALGSGMSVQATSIGEPLNCNPILDPNCTMPPQ